MLAHAHASSHTHKHLHREQGERDRHASHRARGSKLQQQRFATCSNPRHRRAREESGNSWGKWQYPPHHEARPATQNETGNRESTARSLSYGAAPLTLGVNIWTWPHQCDEKFVSARTRVIVRLLIFLVIHIIQLYFIVYPSHCPRGQRNATSTPSTSTTSTVQPPIRSI